MAHAAQLGALTEELVELVTSTSSKNAPHRFNRYREASIRNLRYHNFLRTNQFEVENRLAGLEERFSVHHRDGLARALRQSLDAFAPLRTKWSPDILHFLLEIADQPAQKTDLHDLALLRQPEEGAGPPLTWEDIAREDGSDDEGYQDDKSGAGHDSDDTSVETRHDAALQAVQQSQSWRLPDGHQQPSAGPSRKMAVSEFHMIREALFMLQGLETSLFQKHGQPDPAYQVANMAWETCKALIGWQTMPLLQVFHANVMASLQSFDKELSRIQHRLITPLRDTVVSSIALQRELGPHLEPLNALSDIVRQLEEGSQVGAFRYLELLYQQVGAAQAAGKSGTYEFLGRMFFECFQMYLRPIRLWMHEGELLPADKIFFVADSVSQVPLNQIWQEQFKLRRTSDGKLHVPNFLEPSAAKIFTAGKSIVVLKHLGKYESTRARWNRPEPLLTFDAVCPEGSDFAPFNELFSSAFGSWIQSKHHATSEALKQVLFASCDLWSNMDALESLYFMSDGFVADAFARNLFARIDAAKPDWHDRYLLTGLAQEAFSSRVDAQRLSVTVDADSQKAPVARSRDSVRQLLPTLVVAYRFAWPIQLIITSECLARYQAVFTFLLQIRCGVTLLGTNRSFDSYVADQEDWQEQATYYRLRSKLLWFCNCVHTYLSTLVLAPTMARLRGQLRDAHDVDAMIGVHLAVTRQAMNAACLGSKLGPIRETILDVLDLIIRLERAERHRAAQEAEEMQELSRLSVMSSPPQYHQRGGTPKRARHARDSVRQLLPTLVVAYRFAWPIQLIITSECLARYQAVFTFLLQIRRGVTLLGTNRSFDSYVADQEDWHEQATYYRLRSKLLWFCNCVHTYLSTLVLAPTMARLRRQLRDAHDVDAMIGVHLAVTRQAINAACLGSKLGPIRETILDVLDLIIRLERAERHRAAQEAEEMHELSRLSVMSSPPPYQQRGGTPKRARPARWVQDSDDDGVEPELDTNEDTAERHDRHQRHRRGRGPAAESSGPQDETYTAILAGISGDLERHLRFICGGLRGVARASSDEAAAMWDMLAEMLESGVGGEL
ncbi:Gamma-tubulin complex component 5 like protein [Verticillium longisporum]|nr:Gamma-tubulin complex component 5 like protein [Verticillium longisporum]